MSGLKVTLDTAREAVALVMAIPVRDDEGVIHQVTLGPPFCETIRNLQDAIENNRPTNSPARRLGKHQVRAEI